MLRRLAKLVRAGIAGMAATLVDLGTLAFLVSIVHLDPRAASVPALVLGGIANFIGNRHFAFRAGRGSLRRQAILYSIVEIVALAMNGALYDTALRQLPVSREAYWLVRLVTSHVVFLCFSYPMWNRVFRVKVPRDDGLSIESAEG